MERLQQALRTARMQRLGMAAREEAHGADGGSRRGDRPMPGRLRRYVLPAVLAMLAAGAGVWIAGGEPDESVSLSAFERVSPFAAPSPANSLKTELDDRVRQLDARTVSLERTIESLEARVQELTRQLEAATGPATGTPSPPTAKAAAPGMSATATQVAGGMVKRPHLKAMPAAPAESARPEAEPGPEPRDAWNINLVSMRDPDDAARFAERAKARGFEVQQTPVTVDDTRYWRVRVTGLASAEAARQQAARVKASLGLKEVWITRE